MNAVWIVGAPVVRGAMGLVFRVSVRGVGNVPAGAAILAPNHVSVLDGPALAAVTGWHRRRATRFLIAAEVFETFWGWILRWARQIPISRGAGDVGALSTAIDAVRAGGCAGIFPEGRVAEDPGEGLQRLRSGITRVAIPTGAPVVPVGIWGTQRLWPKARLRWKALLGRPHLAVSYGDPLTPPGPDDAESPVAFRLRLRAAMEVQVQRARAMARDPS